MEPLPLRVLVVDDERPIRRFLRLSLAGSYSVFEAESGAEALRKVALNRPDLVLLDLGLPDMDGMEVARQLREWTQVPIIVVSVREGEPDKVAALDAGADDYLTKPFSVAELMARMRATLRHCSQTESEPVFESEDLHVDLLRREVKASGSPVALTPTEYEILKTLVVHAGKVMTHKQLIQTVWGSGEEATPTCCE